jgi:hypothetical protein
VIQTGLRQLLLSTSRRELDAHGAEVFFCRIRQSRRRHLSALGLCVNMTPRSHRSYSGQTDRSRDLHTSSPTMWSTDGVTSNVSKARYQLSRFFFMTRRSPCVRHEFWQKYVAVAVLDDGCQPAEGVRRETRGLVN